MTGAGHAPLLSMCGLARGDASFRESTTLETTQRSASRDDYLYGRSLYPAAPLSWLAPYWFLLCGAAASMAWTWSGRSLLKLLLALLLVGPLLGTAWAASLQTRWREAFADDPPEDGEALCVATLPYTLPGSLGHRLARWLASLSSWWEQVKPYLGRPVVQLLVSTLFSLAVAAELGPRVLGLVVVGILLVYVGGLSRHRWPKGDLLAVPVPLLLAWLLGHATYQALRLPSAALAACFALTFWGSSALSKGSGGRLRGLLRQLLPQLAAVCVLVAIRQPVAAAVVGLLSTPQVLLVPLLASAAERERYFGAMQVGLLASMSFAALAVGWVS